MRAAPDQRLLRTFRKTSWEFQATFRTPLDRLPQFVHAIATAGMPFEAATLELDEIVFEPKHLTGLCARYSIAAQGGVPKALDATGAEQVGELLLAALGDWVDFLFVPSPRPFVLYGDHDEYTTFLAHRRRGLTKVVEALSREFEEVRGYRLGS